MLYLAPPQTQRVAVLKTGKDEVYSDRDFPILQLSRVTVQVIQEQEWNDLHLRLI